MEKHSVAFLGSSMLLFLLGNLGTALGQHKAAVLSCTFEETCTNLFYARADAKTNTYGWIRTQMLTSSNGTGPDMASGNSKPGYYIYAESSYGNSGDYTLIKTPAIGADQDYFCANFRYHMHGPDVGELSVIVKYDVSTTEHQLFIVTGDRGNVWHEEYVTVDTTNKIRFVLYIKAIRGGGHIGDVAVDDILVFPYRCSDLCQTWQPWTTCSVTCGEGYKVRTRTCSGSSRDEQSVEIKQCHEQLCVPAKWGGWSSWAGCTRTCGGGIQEKIRSCILRSVTIGGCTGIQTTSKGCNTQSCPAQGAWADWSSWGACTLTCGGGVQERIRSCSSTCSGRNIQSRKCGISPCQVPTAWTLWSSWSACTVTCGEGVHERIRSCVSSRGSCVGKKTEKETCKISACRDSSVAVWGYWSNWSGCLGSCGGVQVRNRTCLSGSGGSQDCTGSHRVERPCTLTCTDCDAVYNSGGGTTGVYKIKPVGAPKLEDVFCDMSGRTKWTVIMSRYDGSVSFDRTWADYKAGFGDVSKEHWLGLDTIHYLTNQGQYKLRFEMRDWQSKLNRYAEFSTFTIGPEISNYRITINGETGTAAEGRMRYHNGKPFTTKDKDNDAADTQNCAHLGGGWWHHYCYYTFLTGPYTNRCASWKDNKCMCWHWNTPLDRAIMKIGRI